MTGFGQARLKTREGQFRAEIKSVNHKFLEVSVKLPGAVAEFEETLRREASSRVKRGKVLIFVSCPDPSMFSSRLVLNEKLAREVYDKTQSVKRMFRLNQAGDAAVLSEVLGFPDVLVKDTSIEGRGSYAEPLQKVVIEALENFDRSRKAEGQSLLRDLKKRALEIAKAVGAIDKRIPLGAKSFKKTLETRMKDFLKDDQIDRERLTIEVAQYLKSSDISEEMTRMRSHLESLTKALKEEGELGRKIDFIAQEMTRETNTIGAKSSDPRITDEVIRIKSAIEKVREQAQNVE